MNSNTTLDKLHLIFDGDRHPTPQDRTWALAESGSSQRQVADLLDISFEAVSQCIHGRLTSYNIATKIAEVTGLTLARLWPCGKYAQSPAERRARTQQAKEAA